MIYAAMCGERLWADHYGDGRHTLRQEAPMGDEPTEPLPTEIPDTGDVIDPNAEDPTGAEVTDPDDPNWVEPYTAEGDQ